MHRQSYPGLKLQQDEFHLWYTHPHLCTDDALLAEYHALLTKEETEKQQRFVFEKDRHDALITRAFVRDLLSRYADRSPEDWRFKKGEQGKPEIIDAPLPLRFNLSHTKNMIICAVTLQQDIGCDVEHTERKSDVLAVADRFFSKQETSDLFSLPESQQRSRFFDYWTLKESYIKAWGQGLSIPLSDFSFHIDGHNPARKSPDISLSFATQRQDNPEDWQSWLFYPGEEHRIAVSIRNVAPPEIKTFYRCKFFESLPLLKHQEVPIISSGRFDS